MVKASTLFRLTSYLGRYFKIILLGALFTAEYQVSYAQHHAVAVPPKIFVGKPISLNFQRINIRSVLQLLADFTGMNMVISDTVQGNISLRLNQVPWDQALDIIVTTHHLERHKAGNVMYIDTKKSIEASHLEPNYNQPATARGILPAQFIQLHYAKATDIATLMNNQQGSLLSARGVVSVDSRTNSLWIQDTLSQIKSLKQLIKKLDVPIKQVLIEARIVEVTKDFSRDLGIRWGVAQPNRPGRNDVPLPDRTDVSIDQRLNIDLGVAPLTGSPASMGIALARLNQNLLLDLELSALESEGLADLISSPKLMTTNQQPAIIEAGQEIPYQQATVNGATAVSFKKAVLSLKVTPQITPGNKILMELQINQDMPSAKIYNGVPAIMTKEIKTNVLVNNGQTIVLGGIYQQNKNKAIHRIPFLGQLPVLGLLFGNKEVSVSNDELLIFITPKIILDSQ